ncbi:hypothetical protein [Caldisericum exile]|uniref:DUF2089 domain-containing protein n=1 Tax=Caldisericum exile (strain DSM 21853 / NBRC 104410 / AZM16c01) TaxID=511051 RepID=A0A7U6JFU4_CALEA|nr:hypothetical protein [Caldisericum exile]BAL80824.1 hypothetical protein CSE_06980 [Caldisericum exile AZM16c01]
MKELEKILNLFQEGRIGKDEAMRLIEALYESKDESNQSKTRKIRIEVVENGEKKVSVNMPLSILRFLTKTAKLLNRNYIEIENERIPIDIEELESILNDSNFRGPIMSVDANGEPDGKNTKVIIEVL